MTEFLDNAEITITCPGCHHATSKTISWLKTNSKFTCPGCKKTITVESDKLTGGLEKTLKDAEERLRAAFGKDGVIKIG